MASLTRRAFGLAGMGAAVPAACPARTAAMAEPPPGYGPLFGLKLPAGYGNDPFKNGNCPRRPRNDWKVRPAIFAQLLL